MFLQDFANQLHAEYPEFRKETWLVYGKFMAHPITGKIPYEKNPNDLVDIVEFDGIRYNLREIMQTPYNLLPLTKKQLKRYPVADETQPVSFLIFLYLVNPYSAKIFRRNWKAWFLLDIGPESLWNLAKSYGYPDKKTFETWYVYSLPFRNPDGTIAVRSVELLPRYEYKFRNGIPSAFSIEELYERDLSQFEYGGPELHFDVLAEIATKSARNLLNFAQTNSMFAWFASLESTWKNMLSRHFPADFDWNRQRLPVFFRKWRDYYLWLNRFKKIVKLDEILHKQALEIEFLKIVLLPYPGETWGDKINYITQNNIRNPLTENFFRQEKVFFTSEQMESFPLKEMGERYNLPFCLSSNFYENIKFDESYKLYQVLSFVGRYDYAMKMFIDKAGEYKDLDADLFLGPPRDWESGKLIAEPSKMGQGRSGK